MPVIAKKPTEPERDEKLAVLLEDLERMPAQARGRFLGGKLDLTQTVKVGEGLAAVAFKCPLLTAATICDLLRSEDRKAGDKPTAVYVLKDAAWQRVPDSRLLTICAPDGKVQLNPAAFAGETVATPPEEWEAVEL